VGNQKKWQKGKAEIRGLIYVLFQYHMKDNEITCSELAMEPWQASNNTLQGSPKIG
jgi:hypothetical protein